MLASRHPRLSLQPLLLGLLAMLVACAEENSSASPDAPDGFTAPEDTDVLPDDDISGCLDSLNDLAGVPVAPEGDLSVQVSLAATGDVAWIAWSGAAREGSNLAPWIARLDCRHDPPLHNAVRLHDDPDLNIGQPTLAGSNDLLIAAWQRADGTNDIYLRRWSPDGTPVDAEPVLVRSQIGDEEVAGRTWQPRLTALPDGRFALVATWVDPRWETFRPWMQLLDAEGALEGPGIALVGDPGDAPIGAEADRHESPVVLALSDGSLRIAWDARTDDKDNVVVVQAHHSDGTWEVSSPVVLMPERDEAILGPWLAEIPSSNGATAWLTAGVLADNEAALAVDVTDATTPSSPIALVPDQSAFRTVVVGTPTGTFAAWQARAADSPLRGAVRTTWLPPETAAAAPNPIAAIDMDGQRTHVLYPLDAIAWQGGVLYSWTAGSPERSWISRVRWEPTP